MDEQLRKRLNIAKLIANMMSGGASDEDRRRLDEWLQESPRHAEELERIRQEALKGRPEHPELNGMWKEFEKRIPSEHLRWMRIFRYAALFLLPLCVAAWLYSREEQAVPENVVSVTEKITPGRVKAQLILADGKALDITKGTEMDIREEEGVRISTSGSVLQYEKAADTMPEAVVRYNTLIVPPGGEFSLQLSDGTNVWLNAGSKLRYPVVFTGNLRKVEMEGEVYYDVKHDVDKPFVVRVNGLDVRVLGTSFNISNYNDQVVTTLVSGRVGLSIGQNNVKLLPGEQAILEAGCTNFQIRKVNAGNYALWKEGVFWFEDADLKTILDNLARWYDVDVLYMNPEVKEFRFSVEMKRYEDIDTVLRKIGYTRKVKFGIKGRTITVSR